MKHKIAVAGAAEIDVCPKKAVKLAEEVVMTQLLEQYSKEKDPKAAALKEAKKRIQTWVAAGYLQPQGDNYRVELTYEQQQLLLNGKPFTANTMTVSPAVPTTPQQPKATPQATTAAKP